MTTQRTLTAALLGALAATTPIAASAQDYGLGGVPALSIKLDRNLAAVEQLDSSVGTVGSQVAKALEAITQDLARLGESVSTGVIATREDLAGIDSKIDRQFDIVADIPRQVAETVAVPPNPARTTWVAVRMRFEREEDPGGDRPSIAFSDRSVAAVLNPGLVTARLGCTFFDDDGRLLVGQGGVQIIPPGAKRYCVLGGDPGTRLFGWLLINSDRPVLPDAWDERDVFGQRESRVQVYPVDCADPAGLEFVCQFVQQ